MRVITYVIGLALAAGTLASAATASAEQASPAATAVAYEDWGRAAAPDQVLRKGCNKYRFRYRVNPPAEARAWLIEIFLRRPDGLALAHRVYTTDQPDPDPPRATRRFEICKNSTYFGRHKLSMKVTWYDISEDPHSAWVRPSYFRMKRP